MKSKRLAVFVASLQCDDEVKAESRKKAGTVAFYFGTRIGINVCLLVNLL